MKILGIETSCDETSVAVVEDGAIILSNVTASQIDIHAAFGGVVPEVASRHHVEVITAIVDEALLQSAATWSTIDAIAVTCGPGLLGALLVGVSAAKGYAVATGLPLIGIHHIAGHVAAAMLERPLWGQPFLCLVVSGGHTEILRVDGSFHFSRLGGTLDDAAGEAYDKIARQLGLTYPGGPHIDALAQTGNPSAFAFPRALMDDETYDFSFSGLKSSVANTLNRARMQGLPVSSPDVAASFQSAIVDVLEAKVLKAVRATGLSHVVVAGGVAANHGLRIRMNASATQHGYEVIFPSPALCTDNGAMIATCAYPLLCEQKRSEMDLNAYATLSLATWQDFW